MTKNLKILFGSVAFVYAIAFGGAVAPAFADHERHAVHHILHDLVGDGGHHHRRHHHDYDDAYDDDNHHHRRHHNHHDSDEHHDH